VLRNRFAPCGFDSFGEYVGALFIVHGRCVPVQPVDARPMPTAMNPGSPEVYNPEMYNL